MNAKQFSNIGWIYYALWGWIIFTGVWMFLKFTRII